MVVVGFAPSKIPSFVRKSLTLIASGNVKVSQFDSLPLTFLLIKQEIVDVYMRDTKILTVKMLRSPSTSTVTFPVIEF